MPGTATVIFFSCAATASANSTAVHAIMSLRIMGSSISVADFAPVPGQIAARRPVEQDLDRDAERRQHQDGDERGIVLEGARIEEDEEAEPLERDEELGDDRGDQRAAGR